jgi:hypothetical protein
MLLCIEGAHIFIQNKHEEWRLTRIIQEQYQFQTGAKVEPTEFLLSLYTPEIQQVLEMKEMENHEALSQYIKDIPPEITTSINTELISRVYHLLDVRSLDPNWQWIQLLYWFGMYLISGFSIFGIQVALFQLKDHKYFKPKVYVSPQEWHG